MTLLHKRRTMIVRRPQLETLSRPLCRFHNQCAHDWGISVEHLCARELAQTTNECPAKEEKDGTVLYLNLAAEGEDGAGDN